MPFKLAQTFFIDPATVQNAAEISLTAVDLYFKSKPKSKDNKSGITDPGAELYIVETVNSIPMLNYILSTNHSFARCEYSQIRATADSSENTKFTLNRPMKVKTNREYAIVVKFDGNEDFELWSSKQGDLLVGTTKVSPGPSGKYIGNYYTFINQPILNFTTISSNLSYTDTNIVANTADPWSSLVGVTTGTFDPISSWKPISDTDLKFKVYCARYFDSGNIVTAANINGVVSTGGTATGQGSYNFNLTPTNYEYFLYDRKLSKRTGVRGGERAYQRTVYYPGGHSNSSGGASQAVTISVTDGGYIAVANTLLPNGSPFNWNDILKQASDEYIVVDLTDYDNAAKRRTNVRRVVAIESNTVIRVDDSFDMSNSVAKFFVSPVGTVDFRDQATSFGKQTDLLVIEKSNANLTHRFVNNAIESLSVLNGGSGYSNSDYIIINGYENVGYQVVGGYPARANIVVNGSGTIQNVYLSNLGCGFVNTSWLTGANIVIANSSGGNSSGFGATFRYDIGATIGTEFHGDDGRGGYYKNVKVVNLEIGDLTPTLLLNNPAGTTYSLRHQILYFVSKSLSTFAGLTYFVNQDANKNTKLVKVFERNKLPFNNTPVMPSRSNQFVITTGVDATTNTSTGGSNTTIVFSSNNDFICIDIPPTSHATTYSKYVINNDYTDENTDSGNAFAKHITTKVTFANNKFAEDLLVFLTAYRPANTDIKVFARIHHSEDPEAFDDKDWTMLELRDGIGLYSSPDNEDDYIELTFGPQQAPNTVIRLAGTANVENTSTVTVIGSGTSWQSNNAIKLQVGDLVKISQPLFPNSYVVRVIDSVSSDTTVTINKPVANDDLVGAGLNVDFLGRIGNSTVAGLGYPLQAFNNITNDNVIRYYNSSMVEYDTYNTMQIKIVLLSDATSNGVINIYPKVDDIRAVGVST
jgi:hypothetical protein